jgi:hypothetical protein
MGIHTYGSGSPTLSKTVPIQRKGHGASGELTPMNNLTTFISPSHYVSVLPIRVTVQRTGTGIYQ